MSDDVEILDLRVREARPRRTSADGLSRAPRHVRDEISRALVDGATWHEVANLAARHGIEGVTAMNVTNYRQGAHVRWLEREERLETIRRDSEATAAIVEHYAEQGGSPAEAGLLAAADVMSKALVGLGAHDLQALMMEKPQQIFQLTQALAKIAEVIAAKKPKEVTAAASGHEVGLTPEQKEEAIKRIFGLL